MKPGNLVALGLAALLAGASAAPPAEAAFDQQWAQFRSAEKRRNKYELRHQREKAKKFYKRQHRKAKAYVKRQGEPQR